MIILINLIRLLINASIFNIFLIIIKRAIFMIIHFNELDPVIQINLEYNFLIIYLTGEM